MTNGEKYKTAKERYIAFEKWCAHDEVGCKREGEEVQCTECQFIWLDLEAEEEKPMNCPFCDRQCVCITDEHENFIIRCTNCDYTYGNAMDKEETVKVHNDLCKTVKA